MQHYPYDANCLSTACQIVEQLSLPAFLVGNQGQILAWNDACAELTGISEFVAQNTAHIASIFFKSEKKNLSTHVMNKQWDHVARQYETHSTMQGKHTTYHAAAWFDLPMQNHSRYLEVDVCELFDVEGQRFATFECLRDLTTKERTKQRMRRLFELSPDPVWIIENNHFIDCNDAAVTMMGYADKEQLLNSHPSQLSPLMQDDGKNSFEKAEQIFALVMQQGIHRFEWQHQRLNGTVFDAEVTLAKIDFDQKAAILCTWRDISERRKIAENLNLYSAIFQNSQDAMLISDHQNSILAVNQALLDMTGYQHEELIGQNPRILASGYTKANQYQSLWTALDQHNNWQGEMWDKHKDGTVFPKWTSITANRNEQGEITHYFAHYIDLSLKKQSEDKIEYLVHHDNLTGLLNRHSLEARIAQSLAHAKRNQELVALVVLDIDHFKTINDSLGHAVGDQLLIEIAQRLSLSVRESDILGRMGGDEFIICLTQLSHVNDVHITLKKILESLNQAYTFLGVHTHITASAGVSIYPNDGIDANQLFKNADAAMYHAKASGRNQFQFFVEQKNNR